MEDNLQSDSTLYSDAWMPTSQRLNEAYEELLTLNNSQSSCSSVLYFDEAHLFDIDEAEFIRSADRPNGVQTIHTPNLNDYFIRFPLNLRSFSTWLPNFDQEKCSWLADKLDLPGRQSFVFVTQSIKTMCDMLKDGLLAEASKNYEDHFPFSNYEKVADLFVHQVYRFFWCSLGAILAEEKAHLGPAKDFIAVNRFLF